MSPPEAQPNSTQKRSWLNSHLWQIQPVRDIMLLAAVFGMLWLGYRLSIVTVPLLLALLFAYLFEPIVARVTRKGRVSRQGAAAGILILALVVVVVPVGLGGSFAVVQGARFAQSVARDVSLLQQSIDNPNDVKLRAQLQDRGNPWLKVRDYVVEQQRRVEVQRARSESAADAATRESQPSDPPTTPTTPPTTPTTTPTPPAPTSPSTESPTPEAAANPAAADPADSDPAATPVPDEDTEATSIRERFAEAVEALAPEDTYLAIQWAIGILRANAESIGAQLLQAGGGAVGAAVSTFGAVARILFMVFLTGFFFYFMCVGWPRVVSLGHDLIPDKNRERTITLIGKMDAVIASFIRGRLTIGAIFVVYYILGYWFIGIPAPFILGALVGMLTIVPYAASVCLIGSVLLMALAPYDDFRGEWWWVVGAPILHYWIGQLADDYFLTPAIQGKQTNMDMPTILFASIAGGALAGIYGLLLAIPVAACIKILVIEVFWPHFRRWKQGRAADPLPLPKE